MCAKHIQHILFCKKYNVITDNTISIVKKSLCSLTIILIRVTIKANTTTLPKVNWLITGYKMNSLK